MYCHLEPSTFRSCAIMSEFLVHVSIQIYVLVTYNTVEYI